MKINNNMHFHDIAKLIQMYLQGQTIV